jgi:hypothetical protein
VELFGGGVVLFGGGVELFGGVEVFGGGDTGREELAGAVETVEEVADVEGGGGDEEFLTAIGADTFVSLAFFLPLLPLEGAGVSDVPAVDVSATASVSAFFFFLPVSTTIKSSSLSSSSLSTPTILLSDL